MTAGAQALVWAGLLLLFAAFLALVEEGVEWWAQRRKARVRRNRQRLARRQAAHREAFALNHDWREWL